jgi:hypothetical protein
MAMSIPVPLCTQRRGPLSLAALLALAACATPPAPPVRAAPPPVTLGAGLDRVMGQDARALTALFGDPDQDVRDDGARKLQFTSSACVLDAYLYAKGSGREPVVTWIDARLPSW